MHAFRRIASLTVAVLVLAVPGGALAQTPGDDQYTDPFGGDQEQAPTPTPTPAPTAPPDTSTAPEATAAPETSQAPTATASQTTPPAATAQLPRTGGDPLPFAVAGFWLLLGGVALRARVRPR